MAGLDLLLKDWHHRPRNASGHRVSRAGRMWWEMDHMMYGPRSYYTRRSINNIKRWRRRLEREHFQPTFYAEMNLFVYRPKV